MSASSSSAVARFESFAAADADRFAAALTAFVTPRRWFRSKSRPVADVTPERLYPLPGEPGEPGEGRYLACLSVRYVDGGSDSYVLPLLVLAPDAVNAAEAGQKALIVRDEGFVLLDGAEDVRFLSTLPDLFARGAEIEASGAATSTLRFRTLKAFAAHGGASPGAPPRILGAEQTNTSVAFGDRFLLKIVRKLDDGASPDLEMGERLTARGFAQTPAVAGVVERREPGREPSTVAILSHFVTSEGDAWGAVTRDVTGWLPSSGDAIELAGGLIGGAARLQDAATRAQGSAFVGPWFELARLLGQRTGEMHRALAEDAAGASTEEAFRPEALATGPFAERLTADLALTCERLAAARGQLGGTVRADADAVLAGRARLAAIASDLAASPSGGMRIRVHGDYHLGQVLFTGSDFSIIDFEGEPARSLAERKGKRSPLADVAGMIRSFDYARGTGMKANEGRMAGGLRETRAAAWYHWIAAVYLEGYQTALRGTGLLPEAETLSRVLRAHLLEKALYELRYELDNRPDWVFLPLRGVLDLLEADHA